MFRVNFLHFRCFLDFYIHTLLLYTYFLSDISYQISVYYISPKTEGEKQLLAKGKLPIKVKNAKIWLRKKGAISPSKQKKKRQYKDLVPFCDSKEYFIQSKKALTVMANLDLVA